jgi:DNA-binding NtrC family response regulator
MIENIKTKLWELLKKKEISLAMIFNKEGEILWHRGREIKGRTLEEGHGFSRSCLRQCLAIDNTLIEQDVAVVSEVDNLPESATILNIKSLYILPISKGFFLYIDSGIKESFSEIDREVFKVLGELLGELIDQIREKQQKLGGITGNSPQAQKIRELILKYALEEDPVLILGETGSGKNHIAELIHQYSGRKGKLVTIHTPGIPENLFESEVFGHKRGAFTDARADRKGLVEEARGGTLFFDEISEVPFSFQAKLLRFIETKNYYVLGDSVEKKSDVRILAATNKDLSQAMAMKQFRKDLYFRLQVLEINIPSLRERLPDIEALIVEEQQHLRGKKMGKGFWEVIYGYDWPGNIRELISVLKRAGIHCGDTISGQDISDIIHQSTVMEVPDKAADKSQQIWSKIRSGKNFWEAVKRPFMERDIDRDQAKAIIQKGLSETGGKYVDLMAFFNLDAGEYHRFMAFLSDYRLR